MKEHEEQNKEQINESAKIRVGNSSQDCQGPTTTEEIGKNSNLIAKELLSKTFPQRIKQLRTMFGWKQSEIAAYLGCSQATVAMYENGKRLPSLEMFTSLCVATDLSASWFLGFTNDPQMPIPDKDKWFAFQKNELKQALDKTENSKIVDAIWSILIGNEDFRKIVFSNPDSNKE